MQLVAVESDLAVVRAGRWLVFDVSEEMKMSSTHLGDKREVSVRTGG